MDRGRGAVRSAERAIVSRLGVGVFVLGADCTVLSRNPAAQRLFGDGLELEGGRLCATDAAGRTSLRRAVMRITTLDASIASAELTLRILRPSLRAPYVVSLVAIEQSSDETAVLCTIVDPSRRKVPAIERIASLFGLTGAEARVAVEIGSGAVPKEVAARLGTSYATVRTHLQRVYDKTQLASQAELVALLVQLGMAA